MFGSRGEWKKMKKQLAFLLLIPFVALMVYGLLGTNAWFTATVTTNGSISSGNFDLQVSGGPLDLTKLEPGAGYRQVGEFCLVNAGDYDMKLRVRVDNVSDPGALQDLLKVKLVLKALNSEDHNTYGGLDDIELFSDIPFSALLDWNDETRLLFETDGTTDPFVPDMKSCYKLYVSLSEEAGNSQLSQDLTFDLLFNATQYINPGW